MLANRTTCLVVAGLLAQVEVRPPMPAALELLDRYSRGDHAGVMLALATVHDVEALTRAIQSNGLRWTAGIGPDQEPRRRLVAAALALEFAHSRLETDWRSVRSLVEWGCDLLRKGPPTEGERHWHLAALAVAGGALDDGLLFKPGKWFDRTFDHLAHAEARFPGEPRILLARRFAVRASAGVGSLTLFTLEPRLDRPEFEPRDRQVEIRGLRSLADDPEVGAEAVLRIGYLALVGLRFEEALTSFDSAAQLSSDPYVVYLARFLSGRTLERMGRLGEAERAYGHAVQAVPRAQAAVLAYSALLIRAGRTTDAHRLAAAAFEDGPAPPDPWRLFPMGDYYRWPRAIEQLRGALR
jgi:tetratricopeptide (TPR) repeat protein